MCIDDDDELEEIEELYTIIPAIDVDGEDDGERQYEDLDDEDEFERDEFDDDVFDDEDFDDEEFDDEEFDEEEEEEEF